MDETNVGDDPLYVKGPGPVEPFVAHTAEEMDLRPRPGSPALTAGSTSFDENHNPNGNPTYAASQGPAPAGVGNWSIY